MPQVRKPIPKSPTERVNDAITPYELGNATKPDLLREKREEKISVKGGRDKDFSVKLIDIDTALIEHIQKNIKPTVYQNTEVVDVPVIYAFPERWVAIQKEGYLRDGTGKIMSPIIVINRTDVTKDRNISRNLDSNNAQNVHVFQKSYTNKNSYDRFDIVNNRVPVKELSVVAHPDYVTITYEMNIYANFMEQINKLIESIQYAENSYWGDKRRYQFRVNIDSFPSTVSYGQGDERVVSSKLTIKLYGYLIPDSINAILSKNASFVSKGQIVFNESTVTPSRGVSKTSTFVDVASSTGGSSSGGIDQQTLNYLNTNTSATAAYVDFQTAILTNRTILTAPPTLPPTDNKSFTTFINGVNYDYKYFNINQTGNDITIIFNTTLMGITLQPSDDIVVIGKYI